MTDPRELLAELAARANLMAQVHFSLIEFCGKHHLQLAFCQDRACWLHIMCARQSGKTWGDDGIMLDNAIVAPASPNLFLGLKGTGVRTSNWFPIWRPLCDEAGVPQDWHNETEMRTTFANRSRAMFAGTDDLSNIKKYLGNRLKNGVVIIDEAQDQTDSVLTYLLVQLLPPMLTPTTRVILSGVLPDVPAGKFYSLASEKELAANPGLAVSKGYKHHEWGRAANIHTPEAMDQLTQYMKDHGLTIDDPQIQRDWFMKRVWDLSATAWRYDRERNGYQADPPAWLADCGIAKGTVLAATPHAGITRFTVGADPGGRDKTSVVCWGWGEETQEIQHVFEWVTPRNTKTSLSDIAGAFAVVREHYNPEAFWWDPGSGSMEIDTFTQDYGIPLVKAAVKADRPGQMRRNNDLLSRGLLKVMIGSALEEDYQKARWDPDARSKGQWNWAAQWHPDPAEAARYALQGYFDAYVAPVTPPTHAEHRRARVVQEQKHAGLRRLGIKPPEDDDGDLDDDD